MTRDPMGPRSAVLCGPGVCLFLYLCVCVCVVLSFTCAVWSIMKSVQPTAWGPLPGGMPRLLLQSFPMAAARSHQETDSIRCHDAWWRDIRCHDTWWREREHDNTTTNTHYLCTAKQMTLTFMIMNTAPIRTGSKCHFSSPLV